jgi:hypothetical protein
MDDEWLITLSMSGATALVKAAATDAWQEVRAGFRKLFGRDDPDRERLVDRRLAEVAAKVAEADETTRDGVRDAQVSVWRTRLADLLEEEPDRAEALRLLIGRVEVLLSPDERAQVMGTGSITTVNGGGINVANTGVMRDVNLRGEGHGLAE